MKQSILTAYKQKFDDATQQLIDDIHQTILRVDNRLLCKIAYGMPTYYIKNNRLHFTVYDKEVAFYTSPKVFGEYGDTFEMYRTTPSTIRIKKEDLTIQFVENFVKIVQSFYGERND